MHSSCFVRSRRGARRLPLPREGSQYNSQACKQALVAWAARAIRAQEAVAHLDAWKESLQFVALCKKYFPDEFGQLLLQPKAWTLDPRTRITPIEVRFFELVDQRLFPINTDWMELILEEIRSGEDTIPFIPLYSLLPRPDEWDADSPEHDAVKVLLCFTWNNWHAPDESEWQALRQRFNARGVGLPVPIWYPWRGETFGSGVETRVRDALMALHQSVFFDRARAAGFDWLRTAMEVLLRETGNALIDFDEELMREPIEWSEESIEWFAAEWRVGEKMMSAFWSGLNQLTEQPWRCASLIELWNESWIAAPRALSVPRG